MYRKAHAICLYSLWNFIACPNEVYGVEIVGFVHLTNEHNNKESMDYTLTV